MANSRCKIFHLYLIVSIFLIESLNICGQTHFTITDLGTNEAISGVTITQIKNGYSTTSNNVGYFEIPSEDKASEQLRGVIFSTGTIIYGNFNSPINIFLFNIEGSLIYKEALNKNDFQLATNKLSIGSYFLKIISPTGSKHYRLMRESDGVKIAKQNSENKEPFPQNESDTLLLNKSGYFDQKYPIQLGPNSDSIAHITLLAKQYEDLNFLPQLPFRNAYNLLSHPPAKTQIGDVESVKTLIDRDKNFVYYINSKKYASHYLFASQTLNYPFSHNTFVQHQYNNVKERYLYPLTINYYKALDIYTFEFFSGDGATCEDVEKCYNILIKTSYIKEKLFFYSTNDSWIDCHAVPTITSNDLYEGQNYQALNITENYGYLQKIENADVLSTDLQRHDILLTNGIPIDIPVIAGIITTDFQTPLSHINVLSHNRGTPNMALKDGFSNPKLDSLAGQLVYLSVQSDSFVIKKATIEEATLFWNKKEPSVPIILKKDIRDYGLINLDTCTIDDVNIIGGKASNFATLIKAFKEDGISPPVPEGYFAIPFYYYNVHLEKYGLNIFINKMVSDPKFKTDSRYRKELLTQLRDSIINSPLTGDLIEKVTTKLKKTSRFSSFRFRSSTNAEDIEGFNGAGLYDSFSGELDNPKKSIELAIKKVWASLWNFTAYEERTYFKFDHESCAMAVLVHRGYKNEDANGVAITKNLYNSNHGYTINVQYGEISIVDPQPGIINDQLIIYTFSISGETPYIIEYISSSNIPWLESEHVLYENELYQLGDYLTRIKRYYYDNIAKNPNNYTNYGLDVEFKIDSDISPRKLYIKQVRPY